MHTKQQPAQPLTRHATPRHAAAAVAAFIRHIAGAHQSHHVSANLDYEHHNNDDASLKPARAPFTYAPRTTTTQLHHPMLTCLPRRLNRAGNEILAQALSRGYYDDFRARTTRSKQSVQCPITYPGYAVLIVLISSASADNAG